MTSLNELNTPHVWLRVDEKGLFTDGDSLDMVTAAFTDAITRIVVLSHGWKTNIDDASHQYGPLWQQVLAHRPQTQTDTLLVCLNWPSKTYDPYFVDHLDQAQINALSADAPEEAGDLPQKRLNDLRTETATLLGVSSKKLADAVNKAIEEGAAQDLFLILRDKVAPGADAEVVAGLPDTDLVDGDFDAAFLALQEPPPVPDDAQAASVDDVVKAIVKGPRMAVAWVLNQATYFEMKKRAGIVGAQLAATFAAATWPKTYDLHLIGHSFGGRLVTSFANSYTGNTKLPLKSVTLLQAAYSQHGLSKERGGVYVKAPNNVDGPFVITHTHKDKANYYAYFYASMVSGVQAAAVGAPDNIFGGGATSPFGAMGANGAQHSGAVAITVETFAPSNGKIQNVLADTFIEDHMDIAKPLTGELVAKVIDG
ncbi:hypothetical protein AEAC466_05345 [Asticcacaulis sp. AC466]|uniref:hypothetical protein n=1 Tax=Asticcacaulis sp. AC466 TaxID=1282362 RepID=UPI0003C3E37E|nr:hypothetical protein [Asticcacaulis sp. AC466]ESQ85137.1 hypothetical protein AEAC466_05345 [Asticcacaulis sp. AC466]